VKDSGYFLRANVLTPALNAVPMHATPGLLKISSGWWTRASLSLIAALFMGAVSPHAAHGSFPGRPGVIVFNWTFHKGDRADRIGGLYAVRPGQKSPRQLTTNPGDYGPSFAPSGKQLVFRRTSGDQPGLYSLNLSNRKTQRLTDRSSDLDPCFGRRGMIVFSRFSGGSSYDLFLRTATGRARRLVTSPAREENPVFMPDGKRVIFTRNYKRPVGLLQARNASTKLEELFSVRLDGSGLRRIGSAQGIDHLDASPNGRDLVFESSRRSYARAVWRRQLDSRRWSLVSGNAGRPTYSPAGNRVAYWNYQGIWTRRADGRGRHVHVFRTEDTEGNGALAIDPAWQPLP